MNKKQQKLMLTRARQHVATDRLVRGTYGGEDGRACSLGCHLRDEKIHYITLIGRNQRPHEIVAKVYSVPSILIKMCETVFEGLDHETASKWHLEFAERLAEFPPNYDMKNLAHAWENYFRELPITHTWFELCEQNRQWFLDNFKPAEEPATA